ncbi:hypothetical protein DOT_2948 [Desulfosporosinus sp. OT]|nr:hypothetical protein DOT_2948 [Desulfosporosinus sp. OT]
MTISGRAYRHTASRNENSSRVDSTLPGAYAPSIIGPETKGG